MFLGLWLGIQSLLVYIYIHKRGVDRMQTLFSRHCLQAGDLVFFPPFIVAVGAFNKLPQSQRKSLQELWRCKEFYYCRICIYSLLQYMFGLHLNIFELLYVHIAVPKRCMVRLLNWTHDMQSFPLWILCWLACGCCGLHISPVSPVAIGHQSHHSFHSLRRCLEWLAESAHSWGQPGRPGSGPCNIGERWWNACRHVVNERFGPTCARFLHRDNPSRPQTMYFWCPLSNDTMKNMKTPPVAKLAVLPGPCHGSSWPRAPRVTPRVPEGPPGFPTASSEENLLLFSHLLNGNMAWKPLSCYFLRFFRSTNQLSFSFMSPSCELCWCMIESPLCSPEVKHQQ